MKWGLLLGIGSLCINFCAAADHKQLIRDKGKAIWKDLQAGNFTQDPAPPLLTKESRNYARKVVVAYAGKRTPSVGYILSFSMEKITSKNGIRR